jgi:hypothetical protein
MYHALVTGFVTQLGDQLPRCLQQGAAVVLDNEQTPPQDNIGYFGALQPVLWHQYQVCVSQQVLQHSVSLLLPMAMLTEMPRIVCRAGTILSIKSLE